MEVVFMKYIEINDENRVIFIHYQPFDPINGLGKSEDELKESGYLVEDILEEEPIEGKLQSLYYDPSTEKMWIEYYDAPLTEEQKVDIMNEKLELIMMNQLESEGIL